MWSVLRSLALGLISVAGLQSIPARAQQQEIPAAPIPRQITSAKKVFISNAGEESNLLDVRNSYYVGGLNRAYNQFYAAMKSWGRYELVSAPADADLVFEIGFTYRVEQGGSLTHFKVVVLDPKTRIALWTLTKYVEPAGMAKNRERNYDSAMNAIVKDLENLVLTAVAP